ncbi:MAG TPA: hypothetical protein PKC43_08130 [Phycisphaerales bacterium]|nr:hypothetical protein [Phycisphaerales bacterium]HMP37404.1 hypothetical protein [Phycisphaerales bacterium]
MSRRPTHRNAAIPGLSSARDAAARARESQASLGRADHAAEILRAAEAAKAAGAGQAAAPRKSVKKRKPSSR